MKSDKIIMDLEDALLADAEELKKDKARLDWLLENNKISFGCTSRKDIDVVIMRSRYLDNPKGETPENN